MAADFQGLRDDTFPTLYLYEQVKIFLYIHQIGIASKQRGESPGKKRHHYGGD